MKLKYYLRGMGIGIILTAIVMGFALGGRKATLSNAEIIERAKALGMVEQSEGVLSQAQNGKQEANSNDASTSNKTLDTIREEIPKEDNQAVASADQSVSELAEKTQESSNEVAKADKSDAEASSDKPNDSAVTESTESKKDDTGSSKASDSSAGEISNSSTNEVADTIVPEVKQEETVDASATATTVKEPEPEPIKGKTVTIPGGLGSEAVAALLVKEGLVDNAVSFNQYLVTTGKDRTIRSGTKVIPEGATYEEVANIITKG